MTNAISQQNMQQMSLNSSGNSFGSNVSTEGSAASTVLVAGANASGPAYVQQFQAMGQQQQAYQSLQLQQQRSLMLSPSPTPSCMTPTPGQDAVLIPNRVFIGGIPISVGKFCICFK